MHAAGGQVAKQQHDGGAEEWGWRAGGSMTIAPTAAIVAADAAIGVAVHGGGGAGLGAAAIVVVGNVAV